MNAIHTAFIKACLNKPVRHTIDNRIPLVLNKLEQAHLRKTKEHINHGNESSPAVGNMRIHHGSGAERERDPVICVKSWRQ